MNNNIKNLNQAEDRDIEVEVTIDGDPITSAIDAFMEIRDFQNVLAVRLDMNVDAAITFSAPVLTAHLTETTSANLTGKYIYEFWFKDVNGMDTLASYGTIEFKATFGRFN